MCVRSVIAVCFLQDSLAFEAFGCLQLLDADGQITLGEAAIVERDENDHVLVKDGLAARACDRTTSILGLMVDTLDRTSSLTLGATDIPIADRDYGIATAPNSDSGLGMIASTVRHGQTAVLAEVSEQTSNAVDGAMDRLGGQLRRLSSTTVEAEMAAIAELLLAGTGAAVSFAAAPRSTGCDRHERPEPVPHTIGLDRRR
ncbi:MAG TPA: hypothetical protein VKG38_12455 [Solirubrobacteraceae bacterium]|nr:hypothetical protein [Solirubrobacteraceae bacterium]